MKSINHLVRNTAICSLVALLLAPSASAHFMVAQHGTLNFVDDGVYMVLSLPLSAFKLKDKDGDGAISMQEFNAQRVSVVEILRRQVTLGDDSGSIYLDGLMLAPELDHHSSRENISQLVVMGRYSLAESSGTLSFSTDLFGESGAERVLEIKASRKAQNLAQEIVLTPTNQSATLVAGLKSER